MCERNHASADVTMKKLMEDKNMKIELKTAVKYTAWMHNMNKNRYGYTPLQLVTGRMAHFPGVSESDMATSSGFDHELVEVMMDRK